MSRIALIGTLVGSLVCGAMVAGCGGGGDASEQAAAQQGKDDGHDHGEPASEGASKGEHQHEDGDGDHGEEGGEKHGDSVTLTKEQRERAGVEIATAGSGTIDRGIELLGQVLPDGDRLAHIVPRFPGIVREVYKHIGDRVRPGDVLAVIESSESLAPYDLKTLIGGTIIGKHLTRGEAVSREKDAFVIADLTSVWIDLAVYQQDLGAVRVGTPLLVEAGDASPEAEGAVSYVSPEVDPRTRTATARVVLPNPDGRWRPGLFVTARVLDTSPVAIAIPSEAVQTVEGRASVFVEEGDAFEVRPVTIGEVGRERVAIVSGLSAGERYVARNAFVLKAELGKSSAEHAH